jgi:hypothetical protein
LETHAFIVANRSYHKDIPFSYSNTTKLAGTQFLSQVRPLLGPRWFVCGGDIKQPP